MMTHIINENHETEKGKERKEKQIRTRFRFK